MCFYLLLCSLEFFFTFFSKHLLQGHSSSWFEILSWIERWTKSAWSYGSYFLSVKLKNVFWPLWCFLASKHQIYWQELFITFFKRPRTISVKIWRCCWCCHCSCCHSNSKMKVLRRVSQHLSSLIRKGLQSQSCWKSPRSKSFFLGWPKWEKSLLLWSSLLLPDLFWG